MIENRKVMVIAIDEAYHLLRFGEISPVMDTLKSLTDNKGVKLLLIGSYNLVKLATDYGQVISRSEIVHFERYHKGDKEDEVDFFSIVKRIQQGWPCENIPTFSSISNELMEASLGCVGLLKKLLQRALAMQLKNKGKWDPRFLSNAAKSMSMLEALRKEIEVGEENVKGATYGETLFSGGILKDVIAKMNGAATT